MKQRWIFVDDQQNEAQAFADALSRDSPIEVVVVDPGDAQELLLTAKENPSGVLVDVDLSNATGVRGTGPGIAQDIRVKQRGDEVPEYPIVRFARIEPIAKSIQGDPASDDLFDLKIPKERLNELGPHPIVSCLCGVSSLYTTLQRTAPTSLGSFYHLVGISSEEWERLGHPAFADRILSALQVATHVAAGSFLRSFLLPPGLLVEEQLLAARLGVDAQQSGAAWVGLRDSLPFKYAGAGHEAFARWWAKGLDHWWFSTIKGGEPLSSLTSAERVDVLQRSGVSGLRPLSLPHGSAGDKPWRNCYLSAEAAPSRFIPIDPSESVRLTSRVDSPPWVDPAYAALGTAQQARDDFRCNRSDLDRLSRKHRS